jgi:hypothetical protein
MQAPLSMQMRLIQAAATNDVSELERLRQLDMASEQEYRVALRCAISQGVCDAAMHLWDSAHKVPPEQYLTGQPPEVQRLTDNEFYKNVNADEYHNHQDDILARLAFDSNSGELVCRLAQKEPQLILTAVNEYDIEQIGEGAYKNHFALVCFDRTAHIYTQKQDRDTLLFHTLRLSITFPAHPWCGVQERIVHLLNVEGASIVYEHVTEACFAFDRHQGDEERATLTMLLEREEKAILDCEETNILEYCCRFTITGAPVRLLLGYCSAEAAGDFYVQLASKEGTCATIEACLDHIKDATIDADLSDRLLFNMVSNQRLKNVTRPLAYVLEKLLSRATLAGVRRAFSVYTGNQSSGDYAIYVYLLEHLFVKGGDKTRTMLYRISMLSKSRFCWILQRNPSAFNRLWMQLDRSCIKWKSELWAHQAPIRAALMDHTLLATVLVDLIMSY